jgi:hypothetical protein
MGVMSKLRVAFVNTHPIQYFAPSHIDLSDDGHVAAYVSDALVCGGEYISCRWLLLWHSHCFRIG